MPSNQIKNKIKRGQIVEAAKKSKSKQKLERRLKNRKEETEEEAAVSDEQQLSDWAHS